MSFHLVEVEQGAWFGWGSGPRDVRPDAWDAVLLAAVIATVVPRWSLLVRRLHDRDHTGMWILLLVFTGPIGWLVLTGMVASRSRAGALGSTDPVGGRQVSSTDEPQLSS